MLNDYLDQAQSLLKAGQPFALATVVRAERPTSAKAGAKAIVTADGTLTGWVGGSCAQPSVIRESLKALQDGQPRLLRLCPPEKLGRAGDGITEAALTCISGGTLEVYIEPHWPKPHLIVIGHLPVAEALTTLGKGMGYAVTVMGLDVTPGRFPHADV
ncbi:MAG: XdhC family protein, partial [Chloroflexota bacterium]